MLFPTPNYLWQCRDKNCGGILTAYQDEEFLMLGVVPPKCPKCDGEMEGGPIIHGGPIPENQFKMS
jgi:hypothetical protein